MDAYARNSDGTFAKLHDGSRSKEYAVWGNMLYRCNTPTAPNYDSYGGRGIKVCERWHSFELFFEDMGKRPSEEHSIERIDVNGDYEPSNCRWTIAAVQASNRRNTIKLDGMTIGDITLKTGLDYNCIKSRVRRGWTLERILAKC